HSVPIDKRRLLWLRRRSPDRTTDTRNAAGHRRRAGALRPAGTTRASQPARRRGAGRYPGCGARVNGRVCGHRCQLLRLLVPVGRSQPRAGLALHRAVRYRSDATVRPGDDGETGMNLQAAVFRKVHELLTIESVEFDKPQGCDVVVRTAAKAKLI